MTESGLRAVLEVVSDIVVAADAEGRIVWLNPSAQRLLGASGDLVGTPLQYLTKPFDVAQVLGLVDGMGARPVEQ